MSNPITIHQLKKLLELALNHKILVIERPCYKCNGRGSYNYYDPILDMQGHYDNDDSRPETAECSCCSQGQITFEFKSLEELKNRIKKKIKDQDWTYNFSDDFDVRRRGYFHQSVIQEILWILPEEFTEKILKQYQNNIDKAYITIGLYTIKIPENYKLRANYYFKDRNTNRYFNN